MSDFIEIFNRYDLPGEIKTKSVPRNCPECKGKRYKRISTPGDPIRIRKMPQNCACENNRIESEQKLRESEEMARRIRDNIRRCEIDSFTAAHTFETNLSKEKYVETCKRYSDRGQYVLENGIGLLIYGNVESGKTFIADCMANHLAQNLFSVRINTFHRFWMKYSSTDHFNRLQYLDELCNVDFLFVNDFGVEKVTEAFYQFLFDLIDTRVTRNRPLIITTNIPLSELRNPTDLSNKRLFSRIVGATHPVFVPDQKWRELNAKERFSRIEAVLNEDN